MKMKKSILMLFVIFGFNSLIAQVNNPGSPNLSPSGVPSTSPEAQDPTHPIIAKHNINDVAVANRL